MSHSQVYQTLLAETIEDLVSKRKLSLEQILIQVFESLMQAERRVFLQSQDGTNKGNGYYQRLLNSCQGRLRLQIPRDRQGQFRPLLLEIIQQDAARLHDLALLLYSQGVSHRGAQQIFEAIFGSSVSPSQLSQLVKAFEPQRLAWQQRPLAARYHVVLIDAIHHAVRRGTVAQEAIYVVMGVKEDFTREVLGLYCLPQETAAGWQTVFDDLTQRGLQQVGLVLCDELSGIEAAVQASLPHVHLQLCLVHKLRRLLTRLRHQDKAAFLADWQHVLGLDDPYHTQAAFEQRLLAFCQRWQSRYPSLKNQLPEAKWHYYSAYLHYPFAVRRMLYTTNWIERLNKAIRQTTHHVNSFPHPDAALNLVFMVIQQMEERTYVKPITSFYPYQTEMQRIFDRPQTHNY